MRLNPINSKSITNFTVPKLYIFLPCVTKKNCTNQVIMTHVDCRDNSPTKLYGYHTRGQKSSVILVPSLQSNIIEVVHKH